MRKATPVEGAARAHRIRILPNAAQERAFYGFARVVRWTWNTLLRVHNEQVREWKAAGEIGDAPTISGLKAKFNEGRPVFAAWTSEVGHRDCWSETFEDLRKAFVAKRAGNAKHPVFKQFNDPPSFYVANDRFSTDKEFARLPKVGRVRMTEALRFAGKIRGARVTRDGAGRWFLSVQMAGVQLAQTAGTEVLGIDVGIVNTVTLSTGEVFRAPRMSEAEKKRMCRLQRSVSRKYEVRKARRAEVRKAGGDLRTVHPSNREVRARRKVGQLHNRIADRRNDWQHKTTTAIVRRSAAIGLETLSIKGMLRSKRRGQAKALSDVGLGEVHRQTRYKAEDRVQDFPMFYPSSQLCSACGARQKMPLGTRTYDCPHCGLHLDRDVNAALNLVPSAWRGSRGTREIGDGGEQAAGRKRPVRPVPSESAKRPGAKTKAGSHGLT